MRRILLALAMPALATALVPAWVAPGHAAGLKTTFVKVTLENLRAGDTYNIRHLANLPLAVYNTGTDTISLKVEPTIPLAGELREGYAPIPDPAWIGLTKAIFEAIAPGASGITDVTISIPNDAKYLGKRYQVMIWSHTIGAGLIACGLKSEVLFSVSSETAELSRSLNVLPTAIYVDDVAPGETFDVTARAGGATLRIFNPSDQAIEVRLAVAGPGDATVGLPRLAEGYSDCAPSGAVRLGRNLVAISPHGVEDVGLAVELPDVAAYHGGRYAFIVSATEAGKTSPAACSVIYVSARE